MIKKRYNYKKQDQSMQKEHEHTLFLQYLPADNLQEKKLRRKKVQLLKSQKKSNL